MHRVLAKFLGRIGHLVGAFAYGFRWGLEGYTWEEIETHTAIELREGTR